jgi:hypothetical protein
MPNLEEAIRERAYRFQAAKRPQSGAKAEAV